MNEMNLYYYVQSNVLVFSSSNRKTEQRKIVYVLIMVLFYAMFLVMFYKLSITVQMKDGSA